MSVKVEFTIDEDFTDQDLKVMLSYREMALAIWEIRRYMSALDDGHGYEHVKRMSKRKLVSHLNALIHEETGHLPELD